MVNNRSGKRTQVLDNTSSPAKSAKLAKSASSEAKSTAVKTPKSPAKGKLKGKQVKPPKPKAAPKTKKKDIKIVEKTVNSDDETASEGDVLKEKEIVIEPPPQENTGETSSTTPSEEAGVDKQRNKQFPFLIEEKLELYNWLVTEEMVIVSNKVFGNIPEDHLLKLTDKALEYARCGVTCQPVQLYNFFKSNRKIYTDYLALIKKSGSEAVDINEYSDLNKTIIRYILQLCIKNRCLSSVQASSR